MKPTEAWAALDTSQPDPQWMFTTSSRNATAWAKMDGVTVVPVLIVPREAVREATCIIDMDDVVCEICRDEVDARFAYPTGRVARVGIFEMEGE